MKIEEIVRKSGGPKSVAERLGVSRPTLDKDRARNKMPTQRLFKLLNIFAEFTQNDDLLDSVLAADLRCKTLEKKQTKIICELLEQAGK